MKRLCVKLRARYGVEDALYLQLQRELESREASESNFDKWSFPYRRDTQATSSGSGSGHFEPHGLAS
jgi:hypothetical protein